MTLKTVSRTQGNNRALKAGDISLPDFHLDFEEVPVLVQAFRKMVRELAYDVCEMALTTYICAKAHGAKMTAIPVFLVRDFHHDAILHHVPSGLESPKDLEGKSVGVNRGYTVTTGVWARSIIQEEFGVDLSQIEWGLSGDEHVEAYIPPSNVRVLENLDLEKQLINGELVATVGAKVVHPNVSTIFDDPFSAAISALKTRELYPINHTVVIRDELLDHNPDVALQVFDAFVSAKRIYVDQLKNNKIDNLSRADNVHLAAMEVVGDPLPYGVEANATVLETLMGHAVTQKIIPEAISLEDLFTKSLLNISA